MKLFAQFLISEIVEIKIMKNFADEQLKSIQSYQYEIRQSSATEILFHKCRISSPSSKFKC